MCLCLDSASCEWPKYVETRDTIDCKQTILDCGEGVVDAGYTEIDKQNQENAAHCIHTCVVMMHTKR